MTSFAPIYQRCPSTNEIMTTTRARVDLLQAHCATVCLPPWSSLPTPPSGNFPDFAFCYDGIFDSRPNNNTLYCWCIFYCRFRPPSPSSSSPMRDPIENCVTGITNKKKNNFTKPVKVRIKQ